MLLKHYLDQGVSKTELARRFGINSSPKRPGPDAFNSFCASLTPGGNGLHAATACAA